MTEERRRRCLCHQLSVSASASVVLEMELVLSRAKFKLDGELERGEKEDSSESGLRWKMPVQESTLALFPPSLAPLRISALELLLTDAPRARVEAILDCVRCMTVLGSSLRLKSSDV